ncbi:unnamed protein product [Chrysodeixis includens]|uniref:Uncharacterized protein n=1 Tax=Chrysodeixis includens TaxID=689277 RepID=A0A9P0BM68_CHRIL|nr:unnamed protein product [Chrysodeixis includens]
MECKPSGDEGSAPQQDDGIRVPQIPAPPCTIKVEPCTKEEGRRIDGTCTNPKYPSRGGSPTPLLRMRPAKFGLGNDLRPAMNGSELPSSRLLRTKILSDGFPEDHEFNTLATHVFVFSTVDVADLTVLHLSIVYGYSDLRERQIRTYEGGLLKSEMKDGVERPPGTAAICINNRRPVENACYEFGHKNALETGVIYQTNGYVNDFDERHKPGVYHEYLIGTRWFHTFQDGRTDLYSRKGEYLGTRTTVDDEFRSGILEVNNTEADLTQGAFRQRAAKFDYTIEPDIAERVFGELQSASDLSAIDIMRGRDQGLPPYNEYRKICGLPVAHKFKDFEDAIYADKVEQLRRIYDDEVDDMELMVAIYSERLLHGAWVGPTLFCIMVENLVNWRKSDRFFFEHGDTHAALTLPQLNEVRQSSMARILCDNGDGVEKIQPKAMLNVGQKNKIMPCKEIPSIDLYKWVDPKCYEGKKSPHHIEDSWKTGYNVPWSAQLYDYKK